ncbi:hypothetical protein FRC19_008094, partial [Serendipita sp. 401]
MAHTLFDTTYFRTISCGSSIRLETSASVLTVSMLADWLLLLDNMPTSAESDVSDTSVWLRRVDCHWLVVGTLNPRPLLRAIFRLPFCRCTHLVPVASILHTLASPLSLLHALFPPAGRSGLEKLDRIIPALVPKLTEMSRASNWFWSILLFLIKPDNLGIGPPGPIHSLAEQFQSEYHFYWVDSTNGSATPAPRDIMDRVSLHFSPSQKAALKQLESEEAVTAACEQNFNGYSDCWTAIIFNDIDGFSGVNYTIRADAGLRYINVEKHTSDYEVIVLPVQWALDSAIISLQTNQYPATPQEAPFTGQTNEEQARDIREAYIGGIQALFVLV